VLRFLLGEGGSPRRRLLLLGSHSDDVEIGCGGTILRLAESSPDLEVIWVVLGAHGDRANEALRSAEAFLAAVDARTILVKDFRDGFFPYVGGSVKDFFEELKRDFAPDLILTHQRHDLHQDHRLVSELTWNTFRDHMILEYEIPKWDGDLGRPNLYVPVGAAAMARKVELLIRHFGTQRSKHWFDEETFRGLARLRAMECRAPHRYAEAFHARKMMLA